MLRPYATVAGFARRYARCSRSGRRSFSSFWRSPHLPLAASPPERRPALDRIGHIIVLFLENRSFDHLYGMFPGADGVDDAGFAAIQVSAAGLQFQKLPAVIINRSPWPGSSESSFGVDTRFATGLPNGPFRADRYVGLWERTIDLVHRFYQEQEQIDNGKMDKFVAVSGAGALPMGYFDGRSLKLYQLAAEYTLADRFFHAAFGGGFLNHFLAHLRLHATLRQCSGKSGCPDRPRWKAYQGRGGDAGRLRRKYY